MQQKQLEQIDKYVRKIFTHDETGHDYYHMKRVANMAKEIAISENANVFICEAAGLLHDIGDHKLFSDPVKEKKKMITYLQSINLSTEHITAVNIAIENISFSRGKVPRSLEGKIVQDADRLDAIGAIGIARAFAYGGSKGNLIFADTRKGTTIEHFYDKLLKLKDLMHTRLAKEMALKRHAIMENYLTEFFKEW